MQQVSLRVGLVVVGGLVTAALLGAHASEIWGGLVPCALCLVGRWPYRVAIGLAVLGVLVPRLARWCAAGVVVAMLGTVAVGVVHVGVEAKLWPSPLPGCVARLMPGGALPARPAQPCDDPTYLISGLPVSMAAMSLIFSLGSAAAMAAVMVGNRRGQG